MKNILFVILLFNFLFSNSIQNDLNLTAQEKTWIKNNTVSVGIESAKPYIYYNNYSKSIDGLYGDIFKLVIEKSGLKVTYQKEEWNTLLHNFKNKKLDLLPATFYSKNREQYGFYSDPYYHVREYIYTKKNRMNIRSLKDITNKRVAIVQGYATIKKLEKKYPDINIIQTKNLTQSVTLLLNDEVDALIDYHLVVDSYLRDNSIVSLKSIAQSELDAISVHYLSHIEKPILHSILQKTLHSISKQQKNSILKEWITHPFETILLTDKQKVYLKNNTFNLYTNNWEPFTIYNEKEESFEGLSIDIWKKLVEKTGIQYQFVYETYFLDMLEKAKNDSTGIVLSTSQTKDRLEYADFTIPYSSFPLGIATQIGEKYILDFKDLEGKKVAVGKNYTAHQLLKKHYKNIDFVLVKNTDDALKLLAQEKVFAAVEILPVLINKMDKHKFTNLKISGSSKIEFEIQILVNKKSHQLIEILNQAIEQISKDNQIQIINNTWLTPQRVIKSVDYSLMYKVLIPIITILLFLLVLFFTQRKSNKVIQTQKEELKKLNDRYELTLEAVEDGIWDWDVKNGNLYFSKNWARMIGYEVNELTHHIDTFFRLLHPDDHEPLNKIVNEHFKDTKNNKFSLRIRLKCKNGKFKWIFTRGKAFLNNKNEPYRMVGNHSDITEEIKNEEHMKEQDSIISGQAKMAAMGEMIGNIAHQWRQPLSVITAGTGGT